jgi:membrane associated rhomboid family serine protease
MPAYLFQETPKRGPWSGPDPEPEAREPVREPMFNAPWTAVALVAVIVGGYAVQSRLPEFHLIPFVFSPAALAAGAWWTPLSAVFLHGSWTHAITNAALVLAFGTPVARLFGTRLRGALGFFTFYMACGILASLGYAAMHWGSQEGMVGASGAASGLVAAAARLVAGRGRLGPMFAPFVLTMGAAWLVVNLLVAGVMVAGAANLIPGAGGAGVAWEAHLAGFLAGVLLIGPFAKLAGRS